MNEILLPRTLAELLEAARRLPGPKRYLAGGTDLNVQWRSGSLPREHAILIRGIPELLGIEETGGHVRIGSGESIARILGSPLVQERLGHLVEALGLFASPQIRSMATIGGNIANGSPTADSVPPLLIMEAELELASAEGSRRVPLRAFFTGYKRNVLGDGEIIRAVLVPAEGRLGGCTTLYRKVGSRTAMTIAKLAVAGAVRFAGRRAQEVRLAVGSLSEYPKRLVATEALLAGADPREIGAEAIGRVLRSEITPISDFRSDAAYRTEVCRNLVLDFLGLLPPQSAVPE